MNIDDLIEQFMKERNSVKRYSSFDYCFNYFQQYNKGNNIDELCALSQIQMSCLQLGFFLASWGMFRGPFLLQKSVKYFEPLIQQITKFDKKIWSIDVDDYSDDYSNENITLLLDCKDKIAQALKQERKPTDTLITKIMLGIFGNVPAFDTNFCEGFRSEGLRGRRMCRNNLERIAEFYKHNEAKIKKHVIHTIDYNTGQDTPITYTKAKLIDMIGFMNGQSSNPRPSRE